MIEMIIYTNDKNWKKHSGYQICVMSNNDVLKDVKRRDVVKCLVYISSKLLNSVDLIEYYISENHVSMFIKTKRDIVLVLKQMLDFITSQYTDIYPDSNSDDALWSSATIIPIKLTPKKNSQGGNSRE